MTGFDDRQNGFPKLPIIVIDPPPQPPQPPRTNRDKYGGLLYLGIAGLVVLVVMIAWFAPMPSGSSAIDLGRDLRPSRCQAINRREDRIRAQAQS